MASRVRVCAGRAHRHEDEAADVQRALRVGTPDAGADTRRRTVSAGTDARGGGLLQTQLQVGPTARAALICCFIFYLDVLDTGEDNRPRSYGRY